ncbi:MAG: hypothetical protein JST82_13725 [Bacteroidetes bacterium]|nr:hypothetical protein [Bacteroidota bacterium]
MIHGYRFQKVSLRISQSGQRVYFNTESHKDFSVLKGIALSVGYENALFGSTFGFRVDEKKVLDESHEAHLLVFGNDIAPNERMLFFETPIPIHSSKLEGIYTDSALQSLLGNISYSPGGGVIAQTDVNVKKTYVSGKDIVSYSNAVVDVLPAYNASNVAVVGGGGTAMSGAGATAAAPPPGTPPPPVYYPYDVKITMFLSKQ